MQEQILPSVEAVWRHHCAALDEAISETIGELQNLLRLDDYHRHGHEPDALERSLGPLAATNLDLGSLSRVLAQRTAARAMDPQRLARVQALIPNLEEMKADWAQAPLEMASFDGDGDVQHIRARADAHFARLAGLFAALRMAQLELRSKYDAQTHDAVFGAFDWRQLGPGELRLAPPFVVVARPGRDGGFPLLDILALIQSGMPIKVLALRTSLREAEVGMGTGVPSKLTLETLPLAVRGAYFTQTVSSASDFQKQLSEALTSPRPAVVSVLCRRDDEAEDAFAVRAQNAIRARALPLCVFDPDRDSRFVLCFDLSANPAPEKAWMTDSLSGQNPDGEKIELAEPYTLAHYADSEPELADELSDAFPDAANLVPLVDYLALSRRQQLGKAAFVSLQRDGDWIVRKVVSPRLVSQCAERLHLWRALQEIAGFDNPHVESTRALLTKELGAQQEAHLERLRQQLEKTAADREKAAVVSTVRKLVARLAGVDPTGG